MESKMIDQTLTPTSAASRENGGGLPPRLLRGAFEAANPGGDRPAIYLACLASYNAGLLHGAWVWAEDADDIQAGAREMLAASPEPFAEEWAIHDYAGFEGLRVEEYESFEAVADKAAFIAERGELGAKLAEHFGGNLDEARRAFESYAGEYESLADYAEGFTLETGTEIPAALRNYIDWASMAQDLELNGDVLTIEMGYKSIHVFWSR